MKKPIDSGQFRDLLRLMAELHRLHERLSSVCEAKLEAIRRADTGRLHAATTEELALTRRISEREGLRRHLMDSIGDSLGLGSASARTLPVSQLCERLPDPQRALLVEIAGKLRSAIGRVARIHRVAGMATREVLGHLRRVLASVASTPVDAAGYRGDGTPSSGSSTRIFETVG